MDDDGVYNDLQYRCSYMEPAPLAVVFTVTEHIESIPLILVH